MLQQVASVVSFSSLVNELPSHIDRAVRRRVDTSRRMVLTLSGLAYSSNATYGFSAHGFPERDVDSCERLVSFADLRSSKGRKTSGICKRLRRGTKLVDEGSVNSPLCRGRRENSRADRHQYSEIARWPLDEDFLIDLAAQRGVGPKESERGVLILLVVDDRLYRFEVGTGLEAILPGDKTSSFGREAMPYLRQANYDAALLLMARRVAKVIAQDRKYRSLHLHPGSPPAG